MSEKSPASREQVAKNTGISYLEALKLSNYEVKGHEEAHKQKIEDEKKDVADAHGVFTGIDYAQALQESTSIQAAIHEAKIIAKTAPDPSEAPTLPLVPVPGAGEAGDPAPESKFKLYLGNRLFNAFQKASEMSANGKLKTQERWNSSKEARSEKKYAKAAVLGSAAVFGSLGVFTTLMIGSRTANATGLSGDFLHGAESFMGIDIDRSGAGGDDTTTPQDTYNTNESHLRDRMSTEGAFDGTERGPINMDQHVLEKIKNNPSLMAAALEIRESGNSNDNFSLKEVNSDTRSYTVSGENGEFSDKGLKAVDTLDRSWENGSQGKFLTTKEVNKLLEDHVLINHGADEGKFENARDDATYSAGVLDYRPDLGDKIYAKELNGHMMLVKTNESNPTRDCLNIQTLADKPKIVQTVETAQPTTTTTSTIEERSDIDTLTHDHHKTKEKEKEHTTEETTTTEEETTTEETTDDTTDDTTTDTNEAKGPAFGSDGSDVKLDDPEVHQEPSAGNNTNVDTTRTPDAAANGSGSSDLAEGATPVADRSPEKVKEAAPVAGAGTAATNNADVGAPK